MDRNRSPISLDEVSQDILEKILSRLPVSSFFRFRAVCKRWNSVCRSPTFQIACSEVASREPWLLMVDSYTNQSRIFDTTEGKWKNSPTSWTIPLQSQFHDYVPVAASGGLVCFRTDTGDMIVSNPLTGKCRKLSPTETLTIRGIAMKCCEDRQSYKVVTVHGQFPELTVKVYNSTSLDWEEDVMLAPKTNNLVESENNNNESMYFISKTGDLVVANMQSCPYKQYSLVMTVENGVEMVYFLSHSGATIACNLIDKHFVEYPRLLPIYSEHSIDLVECKGEMLIVMLSEFLDTASIRIWKFTNADQSWHQIAAMPPAMSHELLGVKADINCVSCGGKVFVGINSFDLSKHIMFDSDTNKWMELPNCFINGTPKQLSCVVSFEPRMEARV